MDTNFELLVKISNALAQYYIDESYLLTANIWKVSEENLKVEASVFAAPFTRYYLEKNAKHLKKLKLENAIEFIIRNFLEYLASQQLWWINKFRDKYIFQMEVQDAEDDVLFSGNVDMQKFYSLPSNSFQIDNKILELIILSIFRNNKERHLIPAKDKVSSFSDIDRKLLRILKERPDLVKFLNWRTFEKLIANTLESFGFKVELMQGSKDGGMDLIAFNDSSLSGIDKYVIQAKRWDKKVGIEPVRSLAFLHSQQKATKSLLITTSTFTSGAWKLAKDYQYQISLSGYTDFINWLKKNQKNNSA